MCSLSISILFHSAIITGRKPYFETRKQRKFFIEKKILFFRAAPNIYLMSGEQGESRSPMETPNVYTLPPIPLPPTLTLKGEIARENVNTRTRSNKGEVEKEERERESPILHPHFDVLFPFEIRFL